jgi:hypothetical protein
MLSRITVTIPSSTSGVHNDKWNNMIATQFVWAVRESRMGPTSTDFYILRDNLSNNTSYANVPGFSHQNLNTGIVSYRIQRVIPVIIVAQLPNHFDPWSIGRLVTYKVVILMYHHRRLSPNILFLVHLRCDAYF